ncbi:hypothetical protein [Chlorogloeopsis sp. ULAP02]|uniref:hypothetical protein n=1 Tax=Chlorogloeopsis sp. ULAP02 TaxID=3107926 RepID=UPI003135DD0D
MLNYYIYGVDSQGYDAGLKLDFFDRVRFTNFKKPHPVEKYDPYFDQFINHWSCSYPEFENNYTPTSLQMISVMAQHWGIPVERFINTLLFAGELLWDAEEAGWLGASLWDGGQFIGTLPPPKRR